MSTKGTRALVLTTLVVVTMFATPVSAAFVGLHTDDGATTTASIDTYSATDSIDVWERAALPFRASTDDAEKTVPNPSLRLKYTPEDGETDINKGETAVYRTGSSISLELTPHSFAGTEKFEYDETQLVIGKLEPNASMDFSDAEAPANLSEATDLLTAENANSNATWKVKSAGEVDSSGHLSTSFTPDEPGGYVVFLAKNQSDGFNADSGDLSLSGDVTIIGADTVLVEKASASMSSTPPKYIQPGESVDFDVSSPSGASQNHSVILYDESTWTGSEFVLRINESIGDDLDENDLQLQHSIEEVNGVATFDGQVTLLGTSFNDGSYSGAIGSQSILDFVVEEANDRSGGSISDIDTKTTDTTVLDASAAGKAETQSPTLTIDTYDNWSTDQYRWVYVGGEGSEVYTETDTIWVDGVDPTADAGVDQSIRRGSSLTFDASGSSDNTGHIASYEWAFGDGDTATGETPSHTFDSTGTYTVELTVTDGAGNTDTDTLTVEVSARPSGGGGGGGQPSDGDDEPVIDEPPAKTAALAGNTPVVRIDDGERLPMVGFGSQTALDAIVRVQEFTEPPAPNPPNARFAAGAEITFSSGGGDDVDTIQMGVKQSTLDEIDAAANELVIYHLDESSGEWEELETRVVREDNFEVIVEAPSAGFSSYAIFAQEQVETTTTTTEQPTTTTDQPPTTTETPTTSIPEPTDDDGLSMTEIVVLIIIVAGVLGAAYLWYLTQSGRSN